MSILRTDWKHFLMPLLCQKPPETSELCSLAPTKQFVKSRLDDRYVLQNSESLLNIIVSELLCCGINELFKLIENTVKISYLGKFSSKISKYTSNWLVISCALLYRSTKERFRPLKRAKEAEVWILKCDDDWFPRKFMQPLLFFLWARTPAQGRSETA
jgi:hypothetical protein